MIKVPKHEFHRAVTIKGIVCARQVYNYNF